GVETTSVDETALAAFRTVVERSDALLTLSAVADWMEIERSERPAVARTVSSRVEEWELLRALRAMLRERIPLPSARQIFAAVAETPVFADRSASAKWDEALRRALAPSWVGLRVESLGGLEGRAWLRS